MKIIIVLLLFFIVSCTGQKPSVSYNTEKPWAYWWWHGSSVTKDGISKNLEAYSKAGIGGLHIVPIYGVKGDDENFIEYLSPEWMEMLEHTVSEATKLGLGIDMTSGTGWPFGGPGITYRYSAKKFELKEISISNTIDVNKIIKGVDGAKIACLSALNKNGECEDMTSRVTAEGILTIKDTSLYEKVYVLIMKPTRQKVKRAAPGAEGLVMDYFDKRALDYYFERFEKAFGKTQFTNGKVRAFYNDSYEVYGANFTGDFLTKFKELRGYNLANYLNVIADSEQKEERERILTDYWETISDLLFTEFTKNWVAKSHKLGMSTRNQAHGSPGNILDLYGEADMPETESFGASGFSIPGLRENPDLKRGFGRPNPLMMKFASSSAHLKDRKLVSSETATWLDDHFKVSLSQVKPQIDELFTAGINHIFYHGITYNPPERPFPGRLFYASTNFGTKSHFWKELPALNKYIERCQSILQKSTPDNDVLVYFPIYDLWSQQSTKLTLLTVHHADKWLNETDFGEVISQLWNKGYTFDYVSDRLLAGAQVKNKLISFKGSAYKTIVVPECKYLPVSTMEKLLKLAEEGADIVFCKSLPESVPGFYQLEQRQEYFEQLKETIKPEVLVTTDLLSDLSKMGIMNEELLEAGLSFIRKKEGDDKVYFITNLSNTFHSGNVSLVAQAKQVDIFDPLTGQKGIADFKIKNDKTDVFLQLEPGQSCFIYCRNRKSNTEDWQYYEASGASVELKTIWNIVPEEGGPSLPEPVQTKKLKSWTDFGDNWKYFSGKAIYSAEFEMDEKDIGKPYRIDLGDVRETAKVTINDYDIGLLWCIPYTATIPSSVLKTNNKIKIEVTNLSFNRVIYLDKEGVDWKGYYGTQFMSLKYKSYDASNEEPVESGLLSKVKIIPLEQVNN